jgi:hypothetical protein
VKTFLKTLSVVCVVSVFSVGCGTDREVDDAKRIAQREAIVEQYSHYTQMCVAAVRQVVTDSALVGRQHYAVITSELGDDTTSSQIGEAADVGTLYEPTWKLPGNNEQYFEPWIIGLKKLGTCTPPDQIGVANTTTVLK